MSIRQLERCIGISARSTPPVDSLWRLRTPIERIMRDSSLMIIPLNNKPLALCIIVSIFLLQLGLRGASIPLPSSAPPIWRFFREAIILSPRALRMWPKQSARDASYDMVGHIVSESWPRACKINKLLIRRPEGDSLYVAKGLQHTPLTQWVRSPPAPG